MNRPIHLSVHFALLQVFVVIVGVFLVRTIFLANGYPRDPHEWNTLSLLVRNYGYLLLLIPLAWTSAVIYMEHYGTGRWSKCWTIITGILLVASLLMFVSWCCRNTYNGRMRITENSGW